MNNLSNNNKDKIIESSNEFLCSLVKRLQIKFLHSMGRSMRMLSIKKRNLKGLQNDMFNQQSWGFFHSMKQSPGGLFKKGVLNNFETWRITAKVFTYIFTNITTHTFSKRPFYKRSISWLNWKASLFYMLYLNW